MESPKSEKYFKIGRGANMEKNINGERIIIPDRSLQDIVNDKPADYTPESITGIIKDAIIDNDLIIARKGLSKEDKDAGYFDLECKLSFVIPYFYGEFQVEGKKIDGKIERNPESLSKDAALHYVMYECGYLLKKYLPKRTSPEFKEKYPFIMQVLNYGKEMTKVLDVLESERLSPKITKDFLPYYQNGGSNDLMNNVIGASKKATSDLTGKKHSFKYQLTKDEEGLITLDFNNLTDFTRKKAPAITDGHKKVFFYASYLLNNCNDPYNVFFNYNDFLELKGIAPNKENRSKLKDQLKELNCLYWNIRDKKGTWKGNVRLFSIDKSTSKGAFLRFGEWVDEDFTKTFALIDKKAYSYNEPKAAIGGAFTISQKLALDIFLNWNNPKRNKDGVFSIKVEKFTSLLGFPDDVYSKRGFSYVKDKLEGYLDEISKDEGLMWQYRDGNHNSKDEFINDFIEYRHDKLLKIYEKKE